MESYDLYFAGVIIRKGKIISIVTLGLIVFSNFIFVEFVPLFLTDFPTCNTDLSLIPLILSVIKGQESKTRT